ncbi:chlorophyllase [Actinoplanes sp. NPDC051470]|uniref:alpha/beta hydrolase family protein n=1 Tax=Actinoplanes sp. NPDC051470 TaxID=3157224 RepID=UPI0034335C56
MPRRTHLILIVLLALTAACSPGDQPADGPTDPPTRATSAPVAPSSAPALPDKSDAPRRAPAETLPITTRELDLQRGKDRPLPTTVWYPTSGEKPFPLIVFSHGLTSEPEAYATILRAWAKAGFVVAAPAFPHTRYRARDYDPLDVINQPADVSEVITRMLAYGKEHGDLIDPARIAAAGHSAGGITTVGLFSGTRDARLVAGVVLSGRQVLPVPFQGRAAPMLFVHGKLDKTVPYADGKAAYDAVRWPKALLTVTEGGHVALTKDFAPVIATTTDFLRYTLYGDATARGRLKRDATKGGLATLTDKL